MKHKGSIFFILAISLMVISIFGALSVDNSVVGTISTVITTTTAAVGAMALWFEYRRSVRINVSNFLINLNNSFYQGSGSGNTSKVAELETILDNDKYGFAKYTLTHKDGEMIVKYMTWLKILCEVVYKKVLKLSDVDDLFGAKFFNVVNNPEAQKLVICTSALAYRKIFIVHKMWTAYRIANNIPIYRVETDLSKVENYETLSKIK